MFRRNPALAMVIVLTLGLGIGVNTAIFSIVTAVLWELIACRFTPRVIIEHQLLVRVFLITFTVRRPRWRMDRRRGGNKEDRLRLLSIAVLVASYLILFP